MSFCRVCLGHSLRHREALRCISASLRGCMAPSWRERSKEHKRQLLKKSMAQGSGGATALWPHFSARNGRRQTPVLSSKHATAWVSIGLLRRTDAVKVVTLGQRIPRSKRSQIAQFPNSSRRCLAHPIAESGLQAKLSRPRSIQETNNLTNPWPSGLTCALARGKVTPLWHYTRAEEARRRFAQSPYGQRVCGMRGSAGLGQTGGRHGVQVDWPGLSTSHCTLEAQKPKQGNTSSSKSDAITSE